MEDVMKFDGGPEAFKRNQLSAGGRLSLLVYDVLSVDEVRIHEHMLEQGRRLVFQRYGGSGPLEVRSPVLNRLLSRAYRLKLGWWLHQRGVPSINPWILLRNSDSKPRSKLLFQRAGLPTTQGLLLEESLFTWDGHRLTLNEPVLDRILAAIDAFGYPVVIKPTRGSRGLSVYDFEGRGELVEALYTVLGELLTRPGGVAVPVAFYTNTQNVGTFVERREPHALDVRVPVVKLRGSQPRALGCLARLGRDELQLAKNTALGAVPVGVEPTPELEELCVRAAEALAAGSPAYLVGVDVLPAQPDADERRRVYSRVSGILESHRMVLEQARKTQEVLRALELTGRPPDLVLSDPRLHREIRKLDLLLHHFRELYTTQGLPEVVEEYLAHARLLVTEVNSRPDFGINTHNLATPLLPEFYMKILDGLGDETPEGRFSSS